MAKYDHGGGCPCGLYAECLVGCRCHPDYVRPKTRDEIDAERWRALVKALDGGEADIVRAMARLLGR